jgi:hypothetical protein
MQSMGEMSLAGVSSALGEVASDQAGSFRHGKGVLERETGCDALVALIPGHE